MRRSSLPTLILPALLAAALLGCDSTTGIDFDPDAYEPIPQLAELDWTAVEPTRDWDYWEFRWAGPGMEQVFGSGGRLAWEELDPDMQTALAATRPPVGFSIGCAPGFCYSYVVAVGDGHMTIVDDLEELRTFLAPITTPEEAILLVAGRNHVGWDAESTGFRAVSGGWDVVVHEVVRFCDPVQVDRVRFRVYEDGQVVERAREVRERHEGACV